MKKYGHVVKTVTESPWAIRPERLAAILEFVAVRAAGGQFTPEEIEARVGAAAPRRRAVTSGAVAVVPLYGVLAPKAGLMTQMSGATSLQQFSQDLQAAADDQAVDAILLDVDSPGGLTDLVPETAALVREVRKVKPVAASVNTDAGSAAYWIAAQASEISITPSGSAGSIGVYAAHEDISGMQEADGVKTTLVSAGRYKVEANPFAPLSDEAREAIQARVDEFYGMFVQDVAHGRRVTVDEVRGGFGEGRMLTAHAAVAAGLADRVEPFDQTLARIAAGPAAQAAARSVAESPPTKVAFNIEVPEAAASGLSFADTLAAAQCAVAGVVDQARALCGPSGDRQLTTVKRQGLEDLHAALVAATVDVAGFLADHPHKQTVVDLAARELARVEARRHKQGV